MQAEVVLYVIIGLFGLLSIFSFIIGPDQMVKIVIGNFILNICCLALHASFGTLIAYLGAQSTQAFIGLSFGSWQAFFASGQIWIVLAIYIAGLVVIFTRSSLSVAMPDDEQMRQLVMVILIPFTVISVISGLLIALFGISVLTPSVLGTFSKQLVSLPYMATVVSWLPVILVLHAIGVIFLLTKAKAHFIGEG